MTEEKKRGRKRLGEQPLTQREKNRRYAQKLKEEGIKPIRLLPSPQLRAALEEHVQRVGGSITGNITAILEAYFNLPIDTTQNDSREVTE
jgi:hypothetical protein